MAIDVLETARAMYLKKKNALDESVANDINIWANECAKRGVGTSSILVNGVWQREQARARKLCRFFSETSIELALRQDRSLTGDRIAAIRDYAGQIIEAELEQSRGTVKDWVNRTMPDLESHYIQQIEAERNALRDDLEREFTIQNGLAAIDGIKITPAEVPSSAIIQKSFNFVIDDELRRLCQRDYEEIQRVQIAGAHKATIILTGSLTEALLLNALLQEETKAKSSSKAAPGPLERWDLRDLLEVAIVLGFINPGAAVLAKGIKDYRNLIHPGKEIRSKFHVGSEEAAISRQFLELVIRDLSGMATAA